MKSQMAVIQILAAYNANLHSVDLDHKTPINLLGSKEITFANSVTNFINTYENARHAYPVNFALDPPENIVFKGCGPDGIAYLGAIKELENRKLLIHVKRVAATSGGAIVAALLAVGCKFKEIEELLIDTSGNYFLDHLFTKERVEQFVKDNASCKSLSVILDCVTYSSPVPLLKKIANAVWTCTGICEGRRFLNWIETIIARKTGIQHCTFGELANLIDRGEPFKHLHVYATKLAGQDSEPVRWSSEDPAYKDLIISEAIRAAISVPLVFKPHRLIFKQKIVEGVYEYYSHNSTSYDYDMLMRKLRAAEHIAETFYVDGWLIYPFPIGAFDQRGYIHYGVPEEEKKYYQFNRRTLGLSLYSEEEELTKVRQVQSVDDIGRLFRGLFTVLRHAASLKDKIDCDPRDQNRIIALDHKGISPFDFDATPLCGKGAEAIDGAEKKTREFFEKQESEVKGLMLPSPVNAEQAILPRPIDQAELLISEAQAKELLTLGPKARGHLDWAKASRSADTALATFESFFIFLLPLTIPAMIYRHNEPQSLKSRKLELLSLDDSRFQLFKLIGQGEFKEAYAQFTEHQRFFKALMKTYVFFSTLKKCLMNCDNKYYHWDPKCNDPKRFRLYLSFFSQTEIIPSIIPRDLLYDLPTL